MSMNDPISDMLTRIRNAQRASKKEVMMPSSKMKIAIANVLQEEGYIDVLEVEDNRVKPTLSIKLKYYESTSVIERLERISRPGLRVYKKYNELPSVYGGLGILIISTNKGVISDKKARANKLGGEIICLVA